MDMNQTSIDVGQRIKDKRLEAGMSQDSLAKKCGYASRSSINKIELGINSITTQTLQDIATALGVEPVYFLQDGEAESTEAFRNRVFQENRVLFDLIDKVSDEDKVTIEKIIKGFVSQKEDDAL